MLRLMGSLHVWPTVGASVSCKFRVCQWNPTRCQLCFLPEAFVAEKTKRDEPMKPSRCSRVVMQGQISVARCRQVDLSPPWWHAGHPGLLSPPHVQRLPVGNDITSQSSCLQAAFPVSQSTVRPALTPYSKMGHLKHEAAVNEDSIETQPASPSASPTDEKREAYEVFKLTEDGVDFRTVSWQRATIIFLKIQFAMSILSVPGSMAVLGAIGGALSIVGWDILNTCTHLPANSDLDLQRTWSSAVSRLTACPDRHCSHTRRLSQSTPGMPYPR